jgi:hypothetical protein
MPPTLHHTVVSNCAGVAVGGVDVYKPACGGRMGGLHHTVAVRTPALRHAIASEDARVARAGAQLIEGCRGFDHKVGLGIH